jgi:hypothetical protein
MLKVSAKKTEDHVKPNKNISITHIKNVGLDIVKQV